MEVEAVKRNIAEKYGASDLFTRLMERLCLSARSEVIFGDPVERKSVTVIPVARIRYGLGFGFGGGGSSQKSSLPVEGGGGGGGVYGEPVGFIEVNGVRARFVPIVRTRHTLFIVIGLLLTVFLAFLSVSTKGSRKGK
ncbi:MAG: hypothetical protein H8F28_21555 [Fibrella sp.]|nr:hypothetical protein [Armatimonadota bacterium]